MNRKAKKWIEEEFSTLCFKSKRLEKRFCVVMNDLSGQPEKSVWLASGSRANAKAVYRMLGNEKFNKESILSAHRDAVNGRSDEKVLLAVQDTMSVNYDTHKKTEGMGYNCEQSLGVNVHSCLLVTPEGIPLGLASQSVITREERETKQKTHQEKRSRPIKEKESYRWLETMQEAARNAPEHVNLVHIADREGDIYELFSLAEKIGEKFVIRAVHDRLDTDKIHVMQALRESPLAGQTELIIPANHKNKTKERNVLFTVQFKTFEIVKPQIRKKDHDIEPALSLTLICLTEKAPIEGSVPIEWILATNLEIKNAEDAFTVVGYYRHRWKIERFHFVLKSGCKIEQLQQRSVNGIELMILMYSIIAIHIMQLTFIARNAPLTPCDLIFSETEWKTLYRAAKHTRIDPEKPPSMEEAVLLVAKLGGHVGAKSDGPPGLKAIWLGLIALFTLVLYRDFF